MRSEQTVSIPLKDADETANLGAKMAPQLTAGDCILLEGDVGAGKTHFARALIQSQLQQMEDVPSPTFTLVQTYETKVGSFWHADLYRLNSTLEVEELGLIEAFETDICLVEWPDRLGTLTPSNALTLSFEVGQSENERLATAIWSDEKWDRIMKACS